MPSRTPPPSWLLLGLGKRPLDESSRDAFSEDKRIALGLIKHEFEWNMFNDLCFGAGYLKV